LDAVGGVFEVQGDDVVVVAAPVIPAEQEHRTDPDTTRTTLGRTLTTP